MYIEHLQTPHPEKLHGVEPQLLVDVVDPGAIRRSLEDTAFVHGPYAASTASVYAADMVSREVGKSLWVPVLDGERDDFSKYGVDIPLTPESIRDKQVTNCFGYAIVLSEILEQTGIQHYVGYAANHAFVAVPEQTEQGNRLWYIDALYPSLNQDMTDHTTIADLPESTEMQISKYGRASFRIRAREFMENAGHELLGFVSNHRWPAINQLQLDRILADSKNEYYVSKFKKQLLVASLFEPDAGRNALDEYARYRKAMATDDSDAALDHLISIGEHMPDIDVRSDQHDALTRLVLDFVDQGDNARALQAIDIYFSGFGISGHPNVDVMKGDLLRTVGKRTDERTLALHALQGSLSLYHSAAAKQSLPTANGRVAATKKSLELL